MRKKITLLMMVGILMLAGCAGGSQGKNEAAKSTQASEQKTKQSFGEPVVINGLEISIKSSTVKKTVNDNGETEKLYIFEVSATNVLQDSKGFGAIDFIAVDSQNKTYTVDTNTAAFGSAVEPDKSITGKLYFVIPEKEKITEIQYKPVDKVLKKWSVKN